MKKFKLTASIIGPYLPKTELSLGKFLIKTIESPVQSNIPDKPSVGTEDEALVVLSQEVAFHSKYYIIWHLEAVSSKAAHAQGKADLNFLLSCLELPASSYKYFAKIIKVEDVDNGGDPDQESASSEPIHVLSYKPNDLLQKDASYYEAVLSIGNQEAKDLITKFYEGIKGEILSQGESNMKYYKLLEEISNKTLKRLREQSSDIVPDYRNLLVKVRALINSSSTDKVKVKEIKNYANKFRALDYEQIGERIILTANKFNMKPDVIKTLRNVNKYRAKVLAHPATEDSSIKLEDPRDVRETSRLFLLHYLNKFYNILPPDYGPVIENDSWYQYNYAKSDAKA